MKVEARLSETGHLVRAGDDMDWALVRSTSGKKPTLFCPESTCHLRLVAVEIKRPDGGITRFFRFHASTHCMHRAVSRGVVVPAQTVGKDSSNESDEHLWLKQYVLSAALRFGYEDGSLENFVAAGVRADVRVPGAERPRVEVQIGQSDVPARTERFASVIWLLRAVFNESNVEYLFDHPCVQVRISRRDADGRWIPAQPWNDGRDAVVRATGTLLRSRDEPQPDDDFGFFESEKRVPLDRFLREVWSGERRWFSRGDIHSYAGWVKVGDEVRYREWRAGQQANIAFLNLGSRPLTQDLQASNVLESYPVTSEVDALGPVGESGSPEAVQELALAPANPLKTDKPSIGWRREDRVRPHRPDTWTARAIAWLCKERG